MKQEHEQTVPADEGRRLSEGLGPVAHFRREYWPGCTTHGGHLYSQMSQEFWGDDDAVPLYELSAVEAAVDNERARWAGVEEYLEAAASGSMSRNNSENLAAELLAQIRGA